MKWGCKPRSAKLDPAFAVPALHQHSDRLQPSRTNLHDLSSSLPLLWTPWPKILTGTFLISPIPAPACSSGSARLQFLEELVSFYRICPSAFPRAQHLSQQSPGRDWVTTTALLLTPMRVDNSTPASQSIHIFLSVQVCPQHHPCPRSFLSLQTTSLQNQNCYRYCIGLVLL